MKQKKLKDLNLMDDFLFQAIMTYPDIGELFAQKILELIFHRQFQNLTIVAQKVYGGMDTDLRGARLDLYVEENDRVKMDATYDDSIYDRTRYTIKNMCVEDTEIPYEDGARTIVLYTKGSKGDVSEELRQFLDYMEHTDHAHAVSDTLKELQKMVDIVKHDGEVSLAYMKWFEHDRMMVEEGREEERKNTERERLRAENAEALAYSAETRASSAETRASSAETELAKYRLLYGNLPS